jgi:L-malate glycosyltransferase
VVLRGAHRVAVPSQVLETIAAREWRLPARLIELIPNGVDTERFAPPGHALGTGADERAAVRADLGIDPSAFVIITVGGLRPEKRPDRVLETLALLPPDVHAILVGTGSEREALERRAAEPDLHGRVHLAGARPDPAPMLRAADAFCLPSDTEQMPIAMVEAMAVGLPVVATDVGDVRAILPEEQQDRVVPTGSEAAQGLARGLRALAADPAARAALGRANRARVQARYTQAGMVARYDALYRAAAALDGR